jgi:hypothetical protein
MLLRECNDVTEIGEILEDLYWTKDFCPRHINNSKGILIAKPVKN